MGKKAIEILSEMNITIEGQLDKCKVCPCIKDNQKQACISCEHMGKKCEDYDCGTKNPKLISLCTPDICVLTWFAMCDK